MIRCSDFPEGSRKWHICNGTIDMPLATINTYRVQWGEQPLSVKPESTFSKEFRSGPPVVHKTRPPEHTRSNVTARLVESKGGPGTELTAIMQSLGVPSCKLCKDLANKMDRWGVEGCRLKDNFNDIIDDIMPRAKKWVANEMPFVDTFLPGLVKDAEIRRRVTKYVTQAINAATEKKNCQSPTCQKEVRVLGSQKVKGCCRRS